MAIITCRIQIGNRAFGAYNISYNTKQKVDAHGHGQPHIIRL